MEVRTKKYRVFPISLGERGVFQWVEPVKGLVIYLNLGTSPTDRRIADGSIRLAKVGTNFLGIWKGLSHEIQEFLKRELFYRGPNQKLLFPCSAVGTFNMVLKALQKPGPAELFLLDETLELLEKQEDGWLRLGKLILFKLPPFLQFYLDYGFQPLVVDSFSTKTKLTASGGYLASFTIEPFVMVTYQTARRSLRFNYSRFNIFFPYKPTDPVAREACARLVEFALKGLRPKNWLARELLKGGNHFHR